MHYNTIEPACHDHPLSNPIIAAMITSYARLYLYETALEPLGARALYYGMIGKR